MLPQQPVVLLVHAHRALNHLGLALRVVHHRIKVVDVAQAVTAQRQAVGRKAQAIVARVQRALAVVGRPRVAVGHRQLRDAAAVGHGAGAAPRVGVLEAHIVQHQPLARVEGEPQVPALPAHRPAVHGEAGALRLHHVQLAQASAPGQAHQLAVVVVAVPALRDGQRRLVLLDADNFLRAQVHPGQQV